MSDFSEHWRIAKKSGLNGLKKFAGPQSEVEEVMIKEVGSETLQFFISICWCKKEATPVREHWKLRLSGTKPSSLSISFVFYM